jgi:hypothetical protein
MKKMLFAALAALSLSALAFGDEPFCEFEYNQQVTITNGDVPSYYCYSQIKRNTCTEGFTCGKAPAMIPQQCGFPREVRKRRCIPVD